MDECGSHADSCKVRNLWGSKVLGVLSICAPSELYVDEGIGHGASWQWEIYDLSRLSDGIVIWNGEEQELVFNHFSRFQYDLDALTFSSGWFKSDSPLWNTPAWVELHTQYVHALKRAHDRLRK